MGGYEGTVRVLGMVKTGQPRTPRGTAPFKQRPFVSCNTMGVPEASDPGRWRYNDWQVGTSPPAGRYLDRSRLPKMDGSVLPSWPRGWPWRETWNAKVDFGCTHAIVGLGARTGYYPVVSVVTPGTAGTRYHSSDSFGQGTSESPLLFFGFGRALLAVTSCGGRMSLPSPHAPPRCRSTSSSLPFSPTAPPHTFFFLPSSPHSLRPHQSSMHH